MNQNDKLHHHLIVGEIAFRERDKEDIAAIRVNGIMMDPEKELPVRLLGKAQQILQLNFHQRMQNQNIEVLDVVLMNFVYLGQMTQEEFHKAPERLKLQEKAIAPVVEPIPDLEQAVAQAESSKPE